MGERIKKCWSRCTVEYCPAIKRDKLWVQETADLKGSKLRESCRGSIPCSCSRDTSVKRPNYEDGERDSGIRAGWGFHHTGNFWGDRPVLHHDYSGVSVLKPIALDSQKGGSALLYVDFVKVKPLGPVFFPAHHTRSPKRADITQSDCWSSTTSLYRV